MLCEKHSIHPDGFVIKMIAETDQDRKFLSELVTSEGDFTVGYSSGNDGKGFKEVLVVLRESSATRDQKKDFAEDCAGIDS